MGKGSRWRDSDDDYTDDPPQKPAPRIDIPRLKRKLASKPRPAIPPRLNQLGRAIDGDPDDMREYPEEL